MEYLYHYTSLETLALILKNKTIRFNNLMYVDDIEEAKTADMGNFGRYIYLSCWTEDSEESIPLWQMYTPNMHGVRIKLPKYPFKKYSYARGEYYFTEDVDTYINYEEIFNENKIQIVSSDPRLLKVVYTNDSSLLFPKVKFESCKGATEAFLATSAMEELGNYNCEYIMKDLGCYKRMNWQFQKEWRYLITAFPMGFKESFPPSLKMQQELIRRLENKDAPPPVKQIFLEIDEKFLDGIEVVFGPRMSEAEKILAISLLSKYCPNGVYRDSDLFIR